MNLNELLKGFPLDVTLTDPLTGLPFTVTRSEIYDLLRVNAPKAIQQTAEVAALYAFFARLQHAAEFAFMKSEGAARRWKAAVAQKARLGVGAGAKALTDKAAEEAYRVDPDYDHIVLDEPGKWRYLMNVAGDLKEAARAMGFALRDINLEQRGYDKQLPVEHAGEERGGVPPVPPPLPSSVKLYQPPPPVGGVPLPPLGLPPLPPPPNKG